MKNKIILLTAFLLASGAASAESPLLEAAGKKMAVDKAAAAAPGLTDKAAVAGEAMDSTKTLKSTTEAAPASVTQQAEGAAKEQVKTAVPTEAAQSVETVKSGKAVMDAAPHSSGAVTEAVKGEAAKKSLDMLK